MLEPRNLLSGVTLITHGFGGSVDDWITAMADAIAARSGPAAEQPRYRVEVTDPGHDAGPLSVVNTAHSGPAAASYIGATDIVILLNWTDVAGSVTFGGGYHRSTVDVAAAVAQSLLAPNFLTGLATPLAELPFHLIGHSRGASLVGELAKKLGEQGVWVDQVTTLDPHPVDGVREPWLLSYDFGDAAMTGWGNVAFWDNYWRTDGDSSFDFTGEPVANTHNVQLSDSVLTNSGYSYEHSDVHLWYHGTIDLSPTANDGSYTVPDSWYGGTQPARNASGFYYSFLAGGTRAPDGVAAELGGTAHRTAVNWSNAKWPNVLQLGVNGGNSTFAAGESIPLSFFYADYDSADTISFSLDADRNPYTQNSLGVSSQNVAATGATPVLAAASLGTNGIANGTYYVTAKITDPAGRTRYAYAAAPVTIVTPQPTTRTWSGGGTDNKWSTAANWTGNHAPLPGDYLVFPIAAARQDNVNDYPAATVFGSITVLGGNYQFHDRAAAASTVAVSSGTLSTDSITGDSLAIGSTSAAAAASSTAAISPPANVASTSPPASSIADVSRSAAATFPPASDAPPSIPPILRDSSLQSPQDTPPIAEPVPLSKLESSLPSPVFEKHSAFVALGRLSPALTINRSAATTLAIPAVTALFAVEERSRTMPESEADSIPQQFTIAGERTTRSAAPETVDHDLRLVTLQPVARTSHPRKSARDRLTADL
jgi:hypothetical protein